MKAKTRKQKPENLGPDALAGHPGKIKVSRAGSNIDLGFLDILDALPFYVLLIDSDHNIIHANKAVQTELGLDPKQIVGGYCPKVIHGLDEPWYACPLEEAVQKTSP